jgi:hypothetical protein
MKPLELAAAVAAAPHLMKADIIPERSSTQLGLTLQLLADVIRTC